MWPKENPINGNTTIKRESPTSSQSDYSLNLRKSTQDPELNLLKAKIGLSFRVNPNWDLHISAFWDELMKVPSLKNISRIIVSWDSSSWIYLRAQGIDNSISYIRIPTKTNESWFLDIDKNSPVELLESLSWNILWDSRDNKFRESWTLNPKWDKFTIITPTNETEPSWFIYMWQRYEIIDALWLKNSAFSYIAKSSSWEVLNFKIPLTSSGIYGVEDHSILPKLD